MLMHINEMGAGRSPTTTFKCNIRVSTPGPQNDCVLNLVPDGIGDKTFETTELWQQSNSKIRLVSTHSTHSV